MKTKQIISVIFCKKLKELIYYLISKRIVRRLTNNEDPKENAKKNHTCRRPEYISEVVETGGGTDPILEDMGRTDNNSQSDERVCRCKNGTCCRVEEKDSKPPLLSVQHPLHRDIVASPGSYNYTSRK